MIDVRPGASSPTLGIRFDLSPEDALRAFRTKGLVVTGDYRDLVREQHARAFTVAKMMDADLVADRYAQIAAALERGDTAAQFLRTLKPQLQAAGWWGAGKGTPARLRTIFRTNMQSAYAAGQWQEIYDQVGEAPYLMFDAVDDDRTRPEHAALDNTVLPVGDPFWSTHSPPLDYNCRCSLIQVDDSDLRRLGRTGPDASPRVKKRLWTNPRTGKRSRVPVDVNPTFAYHKGRATMERLAEIAREKGETLPDDLERAMKNFWALQARTSTDPGVRAVAQQISGEVRRTGRTVREGLLADFEAAPAAVRNVQQQLEEHRAAITRLARDVAPLARRPFGRLTSAERDTLRHLSAEWDQHADAIRSIEAETRGKRADFIRTMHDTWILHERPAEGVGFAMSRLDNAARAAVERGMEFWLRALGPRRIAGAATLKSIPGTRSHYQHTGHMVGIARRQINQAASTVHELGHFWDQTDPAIACVVKDFFDRRTVGESIMRLRDIDETFYYSPSEVTKRDRWSDPYIGRVYEWSDMVTEVLSMGLEKLYTDPVGLARQDPEYFEWLIDLLHGPIGERR